MYMRKAECVLRLISLSCCCRVTECTCCHPCPGCVTLTSAPSPNVKLELLKHGSVSTTPTKRRRELRQKTKWNIVCCILMTLTHIQGHSNCRKVQSKVDFSQQVLIWWSMNCVQLLLTWTESCTKGFLWLWCVFKADTLQMFYHVLHGKNLVIVVFSQMPFRRDCKLGKNLKVAFSQMPLNLDL